MQQPHRAAAHPADAVVAGGAGEAAADGHVGAGVERREQLGDLSGIVLAVGVELHRPLVSGPQGVSEAGAQRAANAQVVGERRHQHARGAPDLGRAVA